MREKCTAGRIALTAIRICIKSLLIRGPLAKLHIGSRVQSVGIFMAKADLGLKRTCLSCGMRYYDFNRTPIICPGCQTEFDPEAVIRSRRGRATPKSVKAAQVPAVEAANEEAEEEEVETAADNGDKADSDDADMEFDEDNVDDDIDADSDDSAGLISNDLDEDDDILPGMPKEDE